MLTVLDSQTDNQQVIERESFPWTEQFALHWSGSVFGILDLSERDLFWKMADVISLEWLTQEDVAELIEFKNQVIELDKINSDPRLFSEFRFYVPTREQKNARFMFLILGEYLSEDKFKLMLEWLNKHTHSAYFTLPWNEHDIVTIAEEEMISKTAEHKKVLDASIKRRFTKEEVEKIYKNYAKLSPEVDSRF